MGLSYILSPVADQVRLATLSITNPDSSYPAANAKTDAPGKVAKSTSTTATITITLPTSLQIAWLAVVNHNWAGAASVALTNGAGLNLPIPVPNRTAAGLCVDLHKDLRGLANTTSGVWNIIVTTAVSKVAVGRILLYAASGVFEFPLIRGLKIRPEWLRTRIPTHYEHELEDDKMIRRRAASGRLLYRYDAVNFDAVWEASHGGVVPVGYVQNSDVNDFWFAKIENYDYDLVDPDFEQPVNVTLKEVSKGLHLYYPTPLAVNSITRSGATATATTATAHGFVNGQEVFISGANEPEYNGTKTISNVGATTFDYTVSGTPTTPATGTITVTG